MTIQPERIRLLNAAEPRAHGRYVLYLMQQSQRAAFNPALEVAIEEANRLGCPLLVCFGLLDGASGFPEANACHYAFMLQGLAECRTALERRGIGFVIRKGTPAEIALDLARDAGLLVLDRGYLAIQRRWYAEIEKGFDGRLIQVEGNVVVPIETASAKHEYAARRLRPKLHKWWDDFLEPLAAREPRHRADDLGIASEIDLSDPEKAFAALSLDRSVGPVRRFVGGHGEAIQRLKAHLAGPFACYGEGRNRPETSATSRMSPYLHFGQISPVEIALAARAATTASREDRQVYLEELIVRRELAMNHVFHT